MQIYYNKFIRHFKEVKKWQFQKKKYYKINGITLVALIITIIVLVILAAVTIKAAFNSGIIDTAANGAINYADAQNKEKITFDDLDKNIQDIVDKIKDYGGSGEDSPSNHVPTIGDVTVARVAESTDKLTITVAAEDVDGDNLTYTLLRGDTASNISETTLTLTNISGNTVTFTDTGLTMAKTYYYKVKASDGKENAISANYGSERTWCKAEHCDGGHYEYPDCPECEGGFNLCNASDCVNGKISCNECGGVGYTLPGRRCTTCNGKGITCRRGHALQTPSSTWAEQGKKYDKLKCPICGVMSTYRKEYATSCALGDGTIRFSIFSQCSHYGLVTSASSSNDGITCRYCYGWGSVGGKQDCSYCDNGLIDCTSCDGNGKIKCDICLGKRAWWNMVFLHRPPV